MLDPVQVEVVQPAFNYGQLDSETRIVCQQAAKEIKDLAHRDAAIRIQIGERLLEIKQRLGFGLFQKWIEHEFDWGYSSAAKFMSIAREFNLSDIEGLSISSYALRILAESPKEAQQEALAAADAGVPITGETAKQLKQAYSQPKSEKPEPFPDGSLVWITRGEYSGMRGIIHHHENSIPYVEIDGGVKPMLNHWLSKEEPRPEPGPVVATFDNSVMRAKPVQQISPLEALSNEAENLQVRCDLLEGWIRSVLEHYADALPAELIARGERLLA